ncbi:hypothetical protein JCM6882_004938 [Rhodosporidiobolus microsporus]
MCRWIAYIGAEPILMEDLIERPEHSLLKQVHLHYLPGIQHPAADSGVGSWNAHLNADGWGIGWYSREQSKYRTEDSVDPHTGKVQRVKLPPFMPTVLRSVMPPVHDLTLRSVAKTIESNVVFGHIRATVGSPVALPNCHPFAFGRWLLMHNGAVGGFFDAQDAIRAQLSRAARLNIQGTTDTETVAALFFSLLEPSGPWLHSHSIPDIVEVLHETIRRLITLCTPADGRGWVEPDGKTPRSWISLNLAITDGEKFVALRFAYPKQREAPSLYWSTTAGSAFDRRFKTHPDGGHDVGKLPREHHAPHLIVASEPMTHQEHEWKLMKPGEIIAYDRVTNSLIPLTLRLGLHEEHDRASLPSRRRASVSHHSRTGSIPPTVLHRAHNDPTNSNPAFPVLPRSRAQSVSSTASSDDQDGGVSLHGHEGSYVSPELRQQFSGRR